MTRPFPPLPPSARPLRRLDAPALRARFRDALEAADGAEGAHCIHEAWMRGTPPTEVEAALAQLWQRATRSIPAWLPMHYLPGLPLIYAVTARFRAARRGRHNVYLIILDFSDRRAVQHGIYVGITTYDPVQRFDQHRAGIRAAGSVLKRGRELLSGPVLHLQRIGRTDAVRIEQELASAFADAGFIVEGGH